jgi:hypothetical protein
MKREFDDLRDLPVRRVTVAPAPLDEIGAVVRFAAGEIPSLAAAEPTVLRVQRQHPESVWMFRRNGDPGNADLVGIYSMLMLNPSGLARLFDGAFDFANPPADGLCGPEDTVAGIYKWAVAIRGTAAEGIRAMSRHMQGPRYATANLYARAVGEAAQRLDFNLGFRPLQPGSEMLVYVRQCNRLAGQTLAA